MIGPLLPKGGYRSLITKKKKAETAAFYAGIPKKVFYGGNKEKAMTAPYKSITRRRGRPSKASLMPIVPYYLKSSNTDDFMATATRPKVKRTATPAQLAALAKARAARAAKKTGAVVAVAVAAPKAQGGAKRGRPRKTAATLYTGPQYAYGEYF